jgi:hypothetical protein
VTPHVPDVQVTVWQAVLWSGQSEAVLHWTQVPSPSQTEPPPELHGVPLLAGVVPHVPDVHVAV